MYQNNQGFAVKYKDIYIPNLIKTAYSITRGQCFDKLCEPKIRIDKMIINDQKFSYIISCKMEENVMGIEKGKILENSVKFLY